MVEFTRDEIWILRAAMEASLDAQRRDGLWRPDYLKKQSKDLYDKIMKEIDSY